MRQIRQTLRLHLEAGLTYAQVARALGTGKSTVGKIVLLAARPTWTGLWPRRSATAETRETRWVSFCLAFVLFSALPTRRVPAPAVFAGGGCDSPVPPDLYLVFRQPVIDGVGKAFG